MQQQSSAKLRSPGKYVGGKSFSAERIVSMFPPAHYYDTYVEPCCGVAHVLFAKEPAGHREVLNDLNGDVVNFWIQMRDHAEELAHRLDLPYSRALYYDYYRSLFDGSELEPFERAARWFYAMRGTCTGWLRRSPVGWSNVQANANAYRSTLELFPLVKARLANVLLDNRDMLRLFHIYDGPRTLWYIDPPYIGAEHYYYTPSFDHEALARALRTVQGYVALSYYPHPSLDEWYPSEKWRRITWKQQKRSAVQEWDAPPMATEMLLINYRDFATEERPSLWAI